MLEIITDSTIHNVLTSNEYVIIKIWNESCINCVKLNPIIDELILEYPSITFGSLDSDNNMETVVNYGIRMAPTLLFFKNGILINTISGFNFEIKKSIKHIIKTFYN